MMAMTTNNGVKRCDLTHTSMPYSYSRASTVSKVIQIPGFRSVFLAYPLYSLSKSFFIVG